MTQYRLSHAAETDLRDIWAYLAEHAGREIAVRVTNQLRDAVRTLARNPGLGHRRRDLTDMAVLFWPVQAYYVIYDPDTEPLSIFRVVHASRDLVPMLQDDDDE